MGEKPVLSDPDQAHVIHGLETLDFLVEQDIFMAETAAYADVILPSCSFAEKAGHFINTERLGISNSEMVRVSTRRGTIEAPTFVTKRMQEGVIFVPFHFVEAAAHTLTTTALDPHAKIPEFKVAGVKVEKVLQPEPEVCV